jgi:hypothetical protein
MKRDDDLPIDPLPEATWRRIEDSVLAELEAGPRAEVRAGPRASFSRGMALAIAALVALQIAGLVAFLSSDGVDGGRLASTRFATEGEASETLLGDVSVRLEPRSAMLVVENGAHQAVVVLERGAAHFSVPSRRERTAFVVQAGDVRVEVVGTKFRVACVGHSARVDAYEGSVRVTAHGDSRLLARGQSWQAREQAPAVMQEPRPDPSNDREKEAPHTDADRASPARSPADAPHEEEPRVRFERAGTLEASDPRRALALYHSLARLRGAWGENAQYAEARLTLELGARAPAERLLRAYLRKHPKAQNAADARALLEEFAASTRRRAHGATEAQAR